MTVLLPKNPLKEEILLILWTNSGREKSIFWSRKLRKTDFNNHIIDVDIVQNRLPQVYVRARSR